MSERIYCICPVRHIEAKKRKEILGQVRIWESLGHEVRCPLRETDCDQNLCGVDICQIHRDDVKWSTVCAVWWKGDSQGKYFDLGMAFALHKRIWLMDRPKRTEYKSFSNVLWKISNQQGHVNTSVSENNR